MWSGKRRGRPSVRWRNPRPSKKPKLKDRYIPSTRRSRLRELLLDHGFHGVLRDVILDYLGLDIDGDHFVRIKHQGHKCRLERPGETRLLVTSNELITVSPAKFSYELHILNLHDSEKNRCTPRKWYGVVKEHNSWYFVDKTGDLCVTEGWIIMNRVHRAVEPSRAVRQSCLALSDSSVICCNTGEGIINVYGKRDLSLERHLEFQAERLGNYEDQRMVVVNHRHLFLLLPHESAIWIFDLHGTETQQDPQKWVLSSSLDAVDLVAVQDELFVVDRARSKIVVFDVRTRTYLREWDVLGHRAPQAIGTDDETLYVCLQDGKVIQFFPTLLF